MSSNVHTLSGLSEMRAKASASTTTITLPPAASSTTKGPLIPSHLIRPFILNATLVESSAVPPATAPKGRIIKASMMSGASGLILTGGKFTNVGGAVYRTRPAGVVAPSLPEALLEEPENETVVAALLDNASNLTAMDGVEVDNFGTERLAGQRPKRGQNIEVRLLEGVKDSEIKGGIFTNAATVIYVEEVTAKEKV